VIAEAEKKKEKAIVEAELVKRAVELDVPCVKITRMGVCGFVYGTTDDWKSLVDWAVDNADVVRHVYNANGEFYDCAIHMKHDYGSAYVKLTVKGIMLWITCTNPPKMRVEMSACGKTYDPRNERYLIGRCMSGVQCDKNVKYMAPSNKSPNSFCLMWKKNDRAPTV